ncbi:MAG: SCO family protein [Candidatus Eremiobacteraeota bacterium]|nr:SCO family protein [Candidatus Eremiobacteraeota bacterium]
MMLHLVLAAALNLVPVHGVVLDRLSTGSAIVRTDDVPLMLPASVRRYRITPASAPAGTQIDALLDRSTTPWTLREATAAGEFSPGLPEPGRVIALELGSPLPRARLVDQNGRIVDLGRAFAGKTTLIAFIFSRCPDRTLCPAISGKFAYLQAHLDPARFALVEITLDPPYDSPAVLRRYGAAYGANPSRWSLLTGPGSTIARLLDEFRISSLRVSTSNFLHDDKLFIVTPQSRIGFIADTASWDPQAALAQARSIAGLSSNPFERVKLSLIANVVAFCGGSQFAGIVLLELALFTLIVALVAAALWWVARVLWAKP